ncbi:MAG: OmpW family outer membrane protein [Pseudomonadota bacterium]
MLYGKKILSCFIILGLSTSAFALDNAADDYDSGYYENEGRILFKGRICGITSHGKQKGLPAPTSAAGRASPRANSYLIANGFGAEGATTLFFGDNIAAELGLGFNLYKVASPAVSAIAYNYGNGAQPGKRKQIYAIPLTFTMQYHIAPFGAIRPYVGGGYGGSYLFSKAREFKVKSAHGAVGQVGVDLVMTTDITFNLDVKKYSLSPTISYKTNVVGTNLSPKVKIDPWVISVGMGMKF